MRKIILILVFCVACISVSHAQKWGTISGIPATTYCSFSAPDGLLVGTDAGIYKTTDNGSNYDIYSNHFPSGPVVGISKSGNNCLAYIMDKGMWLSTDNGQTWIQKLAPYSLDVSSYVNGQKTLLTTDNAIYARLNAKDSIIVSTDGGLTWKAKYLKNSIGGIFAAGSRIYNSPFSFPNFGLQYSDDYGTTWVDCQTGLPTKQTYVVKLGTKTYALQSQIFELNADQKSWTKITSDSFVYPFGSGTNVFYPSYVGVSGNSVVAQSGGNTSLAMAKWSPSDNGWKDFSSGKIMNSKFPLQTLFLVGTSTHFLLSQNDSIYRAPISGGWTYSNPNGLLSPTIQDFLIVKNQIYCIPWRIVNKNTTSTTYGAMHVADMSTLKWQRFGTDYFDLGSDRSVKHSLFLINDTFRRIITTSSSSNAYFFDPVAKFFKSKGGFNLINTFGPEAITYKDTIFLYGAGQGSFGNRGWVSVLSKNFVKVDDRTSNLSMNGSKDEGLLSITEHNGKLWCLLGTQGGGESRIYQYDDNKSSGNWWIEKVKLINGGVFKASALFSWNNKLYLGLDNNLGVMVSDNNGVSWAPFNTGLNACTPVKFHSVGDSLIMGSITDVYLLEKNSTTWKNITGNLPASSPRKIINDDNYIYLLCDRGSVWLYPRAGHVLGQANLSKSSISLYPNPATDILNIALKANEMSTDITVDIFSISGTYVKSATVSASCNQIAITDLKPGLYFIKGKGNSGTFNSKFIKQ